VRPRREGKPEGARGAQVFERDPRLAELLSHRRARRDDAPELKNGSAGGLPPYPVEAVGGARATRGRAQRSERVIRSPAIAPIERRWRLGLHRDSCAGDDWWAIGGIALRIDEGLAFGVHGMRGAHPVRSGRATGDGLGFDEATRVRALRVQRLIPTAPEEAALIRQRPLRSAERARRRELRPPGLSAAD
jgi:hypothetical protein